MVKSKTKFCTQFSELVPDGFRETLKERKTERKAASASADDNTT